MKPKGRDLPAPKTIGANAAFWPRLLFGETSLVSLVVISGLLLVFSGWLLAAPGRVVSGTMTWDLFFNLSGAWYLHNGQVAHVDYHDPVGSLYFWLTQLGFLITGPSIFAVVIGQFIITAGLFVAAVLACVRRLPLLASVVFVLFACLLVLIPTNIGDLMDDFTVAMSYNAYGWSALCILSLILFLPPRRPQETAWIDMAVAAALIAALYYLKITYFLAAIVELAVACVIAEHIRAHAKAWAAIAAVLLLNAVAPYNWPYLNDIAAVIGTGGVRVSRYAALLALSANASELSIYLGLTAIAVALWRSGHASVRLPLTAGILIVETLAILSQNAQLRGLPLCVVIVYLLYDEFRRNPALGGRRGTQWVLIALLILPGAFVFSATASIAAYYKRGTSNVALFTVDRTNMRGLAVPFDIKITQPVFSYLDDEYTWLGKAHPPGDGTRPTQYEYVQSILEAAALFDESEGRPGGIVVLDQVNPLPFVLGRRASSGNNLWKAPEFPWLSAEAQFGDANFVLIPKQSTHGTVTEMAVALYGTYLSEHFPVRRETRRWVLLGRSRLLK